jgi:hypothetical protein
VDEAKEALQIAIEAMEETAGSVKAVEEAMAEAEKYEARSEKLAALVAEAKGLIEQARAVQAERARLAAKEAAAAAAAEAAAERRQLAEQAAALALTVHSDTLRLQQMQAQLGSSSVGPPAAPQDAETLCVLCMDAPKDHMIAPCGHQCVCEACAEKLKNARSALCPFCRTPISATFKVFVVREHLTPRVWMSTAPTLLASVVKRPPFVLTLVWLSQSMRTQPPPTLHVLSAIHGPHATSSRVSH